MQSGSHEICFLWTTQFIICHIFLQTLIYLILSSVLLLTKNKNNGKSFPLLTIFSYKLKLNKREKRFSCETDPYYIWIFFKETQTFGWILVELYFVKNFQFPSLFFLHKYLYFSGFGAMQKFFTLFFLHRVSSEKKKWCTKGKSFTHVMKCLRIRLATFDLNNALCSSKWCVKSILKQFFRILKIISIDFKFYFLLKA